MNAHGVAVETRLQQPIMSSLHGMFSLGGLIGAGVGRPGCWAACRPASTRSLAGTV